MAAAAVIKGRPFFGVADEACLPGAVIFKPNRCRPLLEREGPGVTGFASLLQLMAFMGEGNGLFPLREVDGLLRGGDGFLVTPAAITPRKGLFPLLVMAGKAGFALAVIVETHLCRSLLESEDPGMTGFTPSPQLMAFMGEGNGFCPLAEVEDFFRDWNGFPVTPTAFTPCKSLLPLRVMAGKAEFPLGVLRHFDVARPFFGFKQGRMATSAC